MQQQQPLLLDGRSVGGSEDVNRAWTLGGQLLHYASFPVFFCLIYFGNREPRRMLVCVAIFGAIHGIRHILWRGALWGPRSTSEINFFEIECGGANFAYAAASAYLYGKTTGFAEDDADFSIPFSVAVRAIMWSMVTYFVVCSGCHIVYDRGKGKIVGILVMTAALGAVALGID